MNTVARIIEDGIVARESEREAPPKNALWRASDAGKCEIAQLLSAFNVPESDPPDYALTLKFQVCSHLEDFITDTIVRALSGRDDVIVQGSDSNVLADEKLGISGHADIVIYSAANGRALELIEVKALNYFFWRKFEKEPIEKAYFYNQIQVYMHMLNIDSATLVAVERNTPAIHSIVIPFDEVNWWWVESVYDKLNNYYSKRTLPSAEQVVGEKACQFCFYRSLCGEGTADLGSILDAQTE